MCHDRSGETRAPARSVLALVTVERILSVITAGTMKAQAAGLSNDDLRRVASGHHPLTARQVIALARHMRLLDSELV